MADDTSTAPGATAVQSTPPASSAGAVPGEGADGPAVPGQGSPGSATSAPDPFAGWDADDLAFVRNKGWAGDDGLNSSELLKSYRNLESLRGVPDDKLLRLPDDPANMGEVYDKLGRPEAADKYTVKVEGTLKDAVFDRMANRAHEAGLSDAQFSALQEEFATASTELQNARQEEFDNKFETWKQQNPADFQNVVNMNKAIGVSEDVMTAAINGDSSAFYGVLATVARAMGEVPSVSGEKAAPIGQMSPADAQLKIDQMMGDKAFTDRYFHDDRKVREAAANEIRGYHVIVGDAEAKGQDVDALAAENAQLRARQRAINGA